VALVAASVSGIDGLNDGWLVLGLAALGGFALYGARSGKKSGLGIPVIGAATAALSIYERRHVSHLGGLVQVGWGLNLILVGSISLIVAGFALDRATSPPKLG